MLIQIKNTPVLQPAPQARDSVIAAVALMDAQIDQVTGLMMLRERSAHLPIYATTQVFEDLTSRLPLVSALAHYCKVDQRLIEPDRAGFEIPEIAAMTFKPISLVSKAPPTKI